jgi:hypothetical protein
MEDVKKYAKHLTLISQILNRYTTYLYDTQCWLTLFVPRVESHVEPHPRYNCPQIRS